MTNVTEILRKFARREVAPEEYQAFRAWIQTLSVNELAALVNEYGDIIANMPKLEEPSDSELLTSIHKDISRHDELPATSPSRLVFMRRWGWAAAAVLVLAASTVVFVLSNNNNKQSAKSTYVADLPPGSSGAILTFADGKQVILDSLNDGVISNNKGALAFLNDGKLIYNADGYTGTTEYNTMSTPKGRQFRVVLSDGTVVWLNAASSLTYPTVFAGSSRRVKVTGEAYFEVAKNAKVPFEVNVNDKAKIEVLGTHFNVDAYENNKSLNTTLLEGSIKINGTLLRPGQQAQVADKTRIVEGADVGKVLAWKNGLFNFDGASLDEVMKQLERWYDIEVVYEKGIPDIQFGGEMTKNISLTGLLLVLEKSDIHFRLEGRKLIVLP